MKVVFEELGTKLDWIGMRSNWEKRDRVRIQNWVVPGIWG